jgi:hypothetical protein
MTSPEYGDVMDPVHVTNGLEGEHPMGDAVHGSTVSGMDWTNVANWPLTVVNFSEYAAPALSWPVWDVKVGTTQTKMMVDMIITITTIITSAMIVAIPFRERQREENMATHHLLHHRGAKGTCYKC